MSARRVIVLVILAVAVVASGVFVVAGSRGPYPDEPSRVYGAGGGREFLSVDQMAATAELVVNAKVIDAGAGPTTTSPDGSGGSTTVRLVTLDVREVLYDKRAATSAESVKVMDGFWTDGVGYELEGLPWVTPGDVGYFFLDKSEGVPYYTLVGPEGRVMLTPNGAQAPDGDMWTEVKKANGDPAIVASLVSSAARAARTGAAKPLISTVCRPSIPTDEDSEPICEEER